MGGDCLVALDRLCRNWFAIFIDIHDDILNIHGSIRYFRHYHHRSFFMLMPMSYKAHWSVHETRGEWENSYDVVAKQLAAGAK